MFPCFAPALRNSGSRRVAIAKLTSIVGYWTLCVTAEYTDNGRLAPLRVVRLPG